MLEYRVDDVFQRVSFVTQSILGYVTPAAHGTLEISANDLQLASIAGLAEVARVPLTIWNSLKLVKVGFPLFLFFSIINSC